MDATDPLQAWVQVVAALGPVLALAGVLAAATLVWWAAHRERWWTRTRWTLDCSRDPDPEVRSLGLAVFDALVDRAPSEDERRIVRAVAAALLERLDRGATPGEDENRQYAVDNSGQEARDAG